MSKKKKLPHVKLLNVPCYRQGTFDGLCAYYTAAMMLSALFPEFAWRFGEAKGERTTKRLSDDPLIKNYSNEDHRLILARWFYMGEYVKTATDILNKTMQSESKRTKFIFERKTAHDSTFRKLIAGSINDGLPVMLGWSTPDYGNHAVLVTGYWEGHERWLLVNDPGSGADQISWDSLMQQKREKFEVGLCDPESHHGYRPMKSEEHDGSAATFSRWTSRGEYNLVEDEFNTSA